MKKILLAVLANLLFWSCANVELSRNYLPTNFEIMRVVDLDFTPQKGLFSKLENTLFIWQKDSNFIHIYRNLERINTIGGIGSDNFKFNQLSDIAISPDGGLLALDSFQKKIKKFDKDGKYITSFDLQEFKEPQLFDVAVDETFYIYDAFLNEIISTRDFREKNWFSFGNIELEKPQNITVSFDRITISARNETLIFTSLGQEEKKLDDYYQVDKNNYFSFNGSNINHTTIGNISVSADVKWQNMFVKNGLFVLLSERTALVGRFIYEIR